MKKLLHQELGESTHTDHGSLREKLTTPDVPDDSLHESMAGWHMDDGEYLQLRAAILELFSVDLLDYRTQQMERRLVAFLKRSSYADWAAYTRSLYQQPKERRRFLEFLTINVSSFYRDADKWNQLRQWILPELLQCSTSQGILSWSIGCSIGAEPYTLAMLLDEMDSERHHRIFAGDIDPFVLERARAAGPYTNNDVRELPPSLREKYLVGPNEDQFRVCPHICSRVTFEHYDLLNQPTTRLYDLVICRNLVIYFTPAVKERVFHSLSQAIRPGGILFLGGTETIRNDRQYGFEFLAPSFYRRIG